MRPYALVIIAALVAGCASHSSDRFEPVATQEIPAAVQQGFARDFPEVKILSVEKENKPGGQIFYRIHFIGVHGQPETILFNSAGKQALVDQDIDD